MSSIADKTMSTLSYSGGVAAVGSALTLTEWGILAGIATAFLTFFANLYYQRRKDAREQRLYDLQVRRLDEERKDASPKLVWPPQDHDVPAQ